MEKLYPSGNSAVFKRCFILVLVISGIIYSCKKDNPHSTSPLDQKEQNIFVKEAKSWFERNKAINKEQPLATNAIGGVKRKWNDALKPDWDKTTVYSKDKGTIIEMPLFSSAVSFLINTTDGSRATQQNNYTKATYLIQKDSVGVFKAWFMVLVADTTYINGDFNKLGKNTYQSKDAAYSGRLLYFDVQGKFLAGWKFDNGAITNTLSLTDYPVNQQQVNSQKIKVNLVQTCEVIPVTTVTWQCVTAGDNPATSSTTCTPYYTTTNLTQCTSQPGGGSGGGSSGPGTFPPPPPPNPCPTVGVSSVGGQHVNLVPGGGDPLPPASPNPCGVKITIQFNGTKIDPKKETKCFDKTQTARMTIYVQQPNPNTRDMMGTNSVGHTFVGITQGGITRSFGFYPDSPNAAVLSSQDSEIHDNSGELYHVSIAKDISSAQLTNIIGYINNYPPTYTLSSYNCTDFGIAVASLGGLNLPATTGTTSQLGMTFTGRNPGDLGQDMRNMTLPSGAVRTQGQNHGPNKSGTCP